MTADEQRPPHEGTAAETSPLAGNERPDDRTNEPRRRLHVDGYRRGTGARHERYRDRVNGWRNVPEVTR